MRITFVIITRNRPQKVRCLVDSILKTELDSFSIVLIDDSSEKKFWKNREFLKSISVPFKHFSSIQAGKYFEKTLEKIKLTESEKEFLKYCGGLASPLNGYLSDFKNGLQFAPYSPARNLGIYCAIKFFNPEAILFLDDDCLLLYPKKLKSHLKLLGARLNQKTIVAISGLYKDIFVHKKEREKISEKIAKILRGMVFFLWKSFKTERKSRFVVMPSHMLGGTLILSSEVFTNIPFDPYVARGEDHAYALDLKFFLRKKHMAIRDNGFIIGHFKGENQEKNNINVLRDTFRFIYMHAKTGRSFISFFTLRWLCASMIELIVNPWRYKECLKELQVLLFLAPKYAKKNRNKFRSNVRAWKKLISWQAKSQDRLLSASTLW